MIEREFRRRAIEPCRDTPEFIGQFSIKGDKIAIGIEQLTVVL